jgi:hypothetical protein
MFTTYPGLKMTALLVTIGVLSGCTALSSTTRRAGDAATSTTHGIGRISRATTNASITKPDSPRYASARAFARSQWPLLKREAANGGGEHIDALNRLLGENDDAALGAWMQRHYAQLFMTGQPNAHTLVARLVARGRQTIATGNRPPST